jgi:CheY-specific phosphatase CheX
MQASTEELNQIVHDVFAGMLDIEIVAAALPSPPANDSITASVQLTGHWSGTLSLRAQPAQALRFASRFLSFIPAAEAGPEVRDVLGEIVNIIGGHFKATLTPPIHLSAPSVASGQESRDAEVPAQAFQTEDGPFWISLAELCSEK